MKHLGHRNCKEVAYDGDMVHMTVIFGHSGVIWASFSIGFNTLWDDFGATLG